MRAWPFSQPKTPGFGISDRFYLSAFLTRATLPSILDVVNPKPEHGAIEGFGAPLRAGSTKDDLQRPIQRGPWAISSKDQKTVLQMLVMNPDEIGYEPEVYANSLASRGTDPEIVARIRGAWTMAQFTFKSHDPMVYPALDLLTGVVARLAYLGEGVVADPICQRFLLPGELRAAHRADPKVDATEHVVAKSRPLGGGVAAFTLGMQKFALPEFEIQNLYESEVPMAQRLLVSVAQYVLLNGPLSPGGSVPPFTLAEGGFDRAQWDGVPVLELLPPTTMSAGEAVTAALV